MSHPMIELVNLSRSFGANDAVHQLSLNVQQGTTLGLLGMNGAGKSTTLRMLMGLLRPDSGEARIDGLEVIRHGSQSPRKDKDHSLTTSSQLFGSRHPGGINVVMVDGSVHHIPWEVDRATFRNLCVRHDGNPVTIP